jgi:hypothetical protein
MDNEVIDISNEETQNDATPIKLEATDTPSPKKVKLSVEDILQEEEEGCRCHFETFKNKLMSTLTEKPLVMNKIVTLFNDALTDNVYISQDDFDFLLKVVVGANVPIYFQNTVFYELICSTYDKVPKTDVIKAADDDPSLILTNKMKEQPTEIAEHMFIFHRDMQDRLTDGKDAAKKYCIDMFKRLCMYDSNACFELGRAKQMMAGHVATYYNYLNN